MKKHGRDRRNISYIIARFALIMVSCAMILVGSLSIYFMYNSTLNTVSTDMLEVIDIAAHRAEWEIKSYTNVAETLTNDAYLTSDDNTKQEKMAYISKVAKEYGFVAGNMVDAKGVGLDGNNYSQSKFFKNTIQGKTYVAAPNNTAENAAQKITFIAAPIWKDGVKGSTVTGAIYLVPPTTALAELAASVQFSKNCVCNILDNTGTVIASNVEIVPELEATAGATAESEEAKELTKDEQIYADINAAMISGDTNVQSYSYEGTTYYTAYAPIANTDGWSIAITSPSGDFMAGTTIITAILIGFIIFIDIIALIVAIKVGRNIGAPMSVCTSIIEGMGSGDFSKEAPKVTRKDETRLLAEATGKATAELKHVIGDLTRVLEAISNGDLTVDLEENEEIYVGDYRQIYDSLTSIKTSLQDTMQQIDTAAEQVSSGSEQVSLGATNLSQGATQQASSVTQLASNIRSIADLINENASAAENANNLTNEAGGQMVEANEQMSNLVNAMTEISNLSEEISKIIKTIDDIAFQTNILALNAAVEAARAGAAGKGFAVVADEVRNLAGKSAEAAKNTAELIENTVVAIERGTSLVDDVANKMVAVANAAGAVAELNGKISDESKNTALSINEITVGIDQISNIVQTNSATSQQSAAASEELAGQANMLKNLIEAFKY